MLYRVSFQAATEKIAQHVKKELLECGAAQNVRVGSGRRAMPEVWVSGDRVELEDWSFDSLMHIRKIPGVLAMKLEV